MSTIEHDLKNIKPATSSREENTLGFLGGYNFGSRTNLSLIRSFGLGQVHHDPDTQ